MGKSSLFNRLCKKRISICHEEEGVTRDRIYGETEFFGTPLTLIDTGGIAEKGDDFQKTIAKQALLASEEADAIIFVVDGRSGVTQLDEAVIRRLRRFDKKIVLAVNKVDDSSQENWISEFYSLGITDMVPVSAIQNRGIEELLEKATGYLSEKETQEPSDQEGVKEIFVAILGRSNVGKSTLLNNFLQEERSIVSDAYATTRDPIDASIILDSGIKITFIDTAGIRKKKSQKNPIEKFADIRTQEVLKRADVCLFLIDSQEGLTTEEKKIASLIERSGKGCLLLCNKWDLVKGFRQEHCLRAIREDAPFLRHIPTHFISAKTQKNFDKVFQSIFLVEKNLHTRITTGELNRFLERAVAKSPPAMVKGKRLKIYYMTQPTVHPVRFVLFINRIDLVQNTYTKYLINRFREEYLFTGVPLEFKYKVRSKGEQANSPPSSAQ